MPADVTKQYLVAQRLGTLSRDNLFAWRKGEPVTFPFGLFQNSLERPIIEPIRVFRRLY